MCWSPRRWHWWRYMNTWTMKTVAISSICSWAAAGESVSWSKPGSVVFLLISSFIWTVCCLFACHATLLVAEILCWCSVCPSVHHISSNQLKIFLSVVLKTPVTAWDSSCYLVNSLHQTRKYWIHVGLLTLRALVCWSDKSLYCTEERKWKWQKWEKNTWFTFYTRLGGSCCFWQTFFYIILDIAYI